MPAEMFDPPRDRDSPVMDRPTGKQKAPVFSLLY